MKAFVYSLVIFGLCGSMIAAPNEAAAGENPVTDLIRAQQLKQKITLLKKSGSAALTSNRLPEIAVTSASGGISGTISGLTADDIPGAWVMAWAKNDNVVNGDSLGSFGYSTLQPDGTYLISGLKTGLFTVYAAADNYVPQYYGSSSDSSGQGTVSVTDGEITTGIDFDLVRLDLGTGTITGRVTNQATGEPVAWASVMAVDESNPNWYNYGWTTTDQNGLYKMQYLNPGTYTVSVWANGYLYTYYPGVIDRADAVGVPVAANSTVANVDFSMKEGAKIKGRVTDQNGNPIPYAFVEGMTHPEGGPVDTNAVSFYSAASTDEAGYYELSGLGSGDWIVHASSYWFPYYYFDLYYNQVHTYEEATPVSIDGDQVVTGINFTFNASIPTSTVSGRLVNAEGNPIPSVLLFLEPDGLPVGDDSVVTVWDHSDYPRTFTSYTDSNGYFVFSRIREGDYVLRAQVNHNWYQQWFWYPGVTNRDLATVLEVKDGEDISDLDFIADMTEVSASVSGTVKTPAGEPLANAWIWLVSAQSLSSADSFRDSLTYFPVWASAVTDANGFYEVSPLPAGTYLLQASWYDGVKQAFIWYENAGNSFDATPVPLSASEKKTGIDMILNPKSIFGSLEGSVKWADGSVVTNAYIELAPYWDSSNLADWYWGNWNQFTTTDSNGKFRFDQLPEGQYTVTIYANGDHVYYPNGLTLGMAEPITVTPGETTILTSQLTKSDKGEGAISGKVSVEDSLFTENAKFVVVAHPTATAMVWPQSAFFYSAVTNEDGTYELSDMADGEYLVYAFGSGTIGEFYDGAYSGSNAKPVIVKDQQVTGNIHFTLSHGYWIGSPADSLEHGRGGRIFGKVRNKLSDLMPEAIVNLVDQAGKVVMSVKTNAMGHYELSGVPEGNYSIKAEKTGQGESAGSQEMMSISNNSVEKDLIIALTNSPVDVEESELQPDGLSLLSVYPNPFNPETTISFRMAKAGLLTAQVFNVLGQQIRDLSILVPSAGESSVRWDGRDSNGSQVSSGLYIIRLSAGNQVFSSKMILSR